MGRYQEIIIIIKKVNLTDWFTAHNSPICYLWGLEQSARGVQCTSWSVSLPRAGRSGRMCVPALPAACGRWLGGFLHSSAGSTPFSAAIHSSSLLLTNIIYGGALPSPPEGRGLAGGMWITPHTLNMLYGINTTTVPAVSRLLCQTVNVCWLLFSFFFPLISS